MISILLKVFTTLKFKVPSAFQNSLKINDLFTKAGNLNDNYPQTPGTIRNRQSKQQIKL